MSTTLVRRPPRPATTSLSTEPITLASPPVIPEPANPAMGMTMIAMPMMAGSSGLIMALTNLERPLFAMLGLLMVVGSVTLGGIMFLSIRLGPRRKLREQRERYLDYLDDMRGLVRDTARAQRRASAHRHPHAPLLAHLATAPERRWERRGTEPDAFHLRCGLGSVPLSRTLSLKIDSSNPLTAYDPVAHSGAEELVHRYVELGNQPLTVALDECSAVSVVGDPADCRGLVRAMLAQLVTLVSPEDAGVAVVRHPAVAGQWRWVGYLPHALAEPGDLPGMPAALLCDTTDALAQRLADDLASRTADWRRRRGGPPGPGTRRLVVVLDGEHQVSLSGFGEADIPPAELGIHVIVLVPEQRQEPEGTQVRLTATPHGTLTIEYPSRVVPVGAQPEVRTGTADRLGVAECAGIARAMSPYRLVERDAGEALHTVHPLTEILGVSDPATFDPSTQWGTLPEADLLRAPFAVAADGGVVELDLKESALGGMGPHGLIIGATGSGKSEALRTLVVALAARHSPEQLALLTVDFKGGATFADCDLLPHNAGSITNLADDLALVDRFREALYGELVRRQQLLKDAGNLPNLHAYTRLRRTTPQLPPVPHLLVIIDEFSELLTAKPDFSELFLAVGRIGRSIGVHLLLATQRLESGQIRGLESHLSYRIGLRTFSEAESREAIGVPDAYHLPPEPGSGYLKVDTSVFTRFKVAMVSDAYTPPAGDRDRGLPVLPWPPPPPLPVAADLAGSGVGEEDLPDHDPASAGAMTVLRLMVERMAGAGHPRVDPVWLPPLPEVLALDGVPGGADAADTADPVAAVLGLRDDPRGQVQEPLRWDLTGAQANLLVFGAPSAGKSILVRTLVASLALRYPPGQVACYCVDYGGGTLADLRQLPQVAAVASRAEPELVRRVIAEVRHALDTREVLMRQLKLDSPARLRKAWAAGALPAAAAGDVVLVIDGWPALRESDPDLEDPLREIAGRGPALGVHTVLTAVTPTQLRSRLSASFGGQLELRLTDSFDSGIDRKRNDALPKELPGRVLCQDEQFGHIALPRVDGGTDPEELAAGMAELARTVARRWPDRPVPRVRTLPDLVPLSELQAPWQPADGQDPHALRPILGLSERNLEPVELRLANEPHLTIYGDPQTGKSTALRVLLRQLIRRPAGEVGIVLVDYRRAHLGEVPEEYLLSYITSAPHAAQNARELADQLRERMPGPDVTPDQLRNRSWWQGMEVFVVVDDYDLVATSNGNPLAPLTEFVPHGGDLGLHLLLARRAGGASRALYEKLLQAVGDQAPPGLLFSGDRMEGRLSNGVACQRLPVGRALLTHRGSAPELVQVAHA